MPQQQNLCTLRSIGWLVVGLVALLAFVWQAPPLRALLGVAGVMPLWVHQLVETSSIVIAMLVFGVVWNAYSKERPGNILILACALLAVGLIDFAHLLSFRGMPDFITPSGPEKGLNFWLSARFIAALALLTVALRPWKPLASPFSRYKLLAGSLAVTALVYWLGLYHEQAWPNTYIEGQGLTTFKIAAEYVIIAILLAAAVLFYLDARRPHPKPFDAPSLFAAAAITILSELSFTLYSDVTDVMNLLGHLYKIMADLFIYHAVFVASVREPFERLREASRRRLERTQYMVDHAGDMVFWVDRRARILYANQSACRRLGYEREGIEELKVHDIDPAYSADRWPLFWEEVKAGGTVCIETTMHTRLGELYPAEVTINFVTFGDEEYMCAFARDISRRRQAEAQLRDLNDSLQKRVDEAVRQNVEQERMLLLQSRHAAMGEMIGNIAHQWRQPLNTLNMVLTNIKDDFQFNELTAKGLDSLVAQGMRLTQKMSDTIDDFRDFFRPSKEKSAFSLRKELDVTLNLPGASLKNNEIGITVEGGEEVMAYGYPNEFSQVLVNILGNAKDAIMARHPAHGAIHVRIASEGEHALLAICDNGGGIAQETLPHIFEPYFTTKEQGTGIGLYMSKLIIEHNMGGTFDVRNTDDGAEFIIRCPLAA